MSEYLIQGETLTGIADAIREKTGGTEPVAVSDMAGKIEGIQAGGGDDVLDALIDRSITEISSSSATSIGDYAFSHCSKLTTVDFPAATSIRSSAFQFCDVLTTVDFPAVTSIGDHAFNYCSALTTVDFPAATSIESSAFQFCSALTTVDFPAATSIGNSAFSHCSALTTVDFPAATSIESSAFQFCSALTTVDFPAATSIGNSAFNYCSKLTTANFPAATSIESSALRSCDVLKALLLRGNNVCALSNTNAFNSTPIRSGTGYIYVPSALIEQYKAATNWSTYAAQFRALEDYTVDGTITGELDPAKTGT